MPGAVITHSDHGCGPAVTAALAAAGYDVAEVPGAELVARAATAHAVRAAIDRVGGPAVLVNNMPPLPQARALDSPLEAFAASVDAGVNSVFTACREAAQAANGEPLVIVNVVSVLGIVALEGAVSTACTSAAVIAASRALAAEWGPLGIRVAAVVVGPTPDWLGSGDAPIPGVLPLGRPVSCEDVAGGISYLVNAPAAAGEALLLDAGWLAFGWRKGDG